MPWHRPLIFSTLGLSGARCQALGGNTCLSKSHMSAKTSPLLKEARVSCSFHTQFIRMHTIIYIIYISFWRANAQDTCQQSLTLQMLTLQMDCHHGEKNSHVGVYAKCIFQPKGLKEVLDSVFFWATSVCMKRLSSIWQQLQDTSVYFPPPLCPKEVKARVPFFPFFPVYFFSCLWNTPQQEEENLPSSLHSQLHSQYCLGVIAFNFIWVMLNMQKKRKQWGKKTLTPCLLSSFSSGPLHRSKLVCSSRSFGRFSPKLLNKKQNKGRKKKRNMSDTPGNLSVSQTPNIGACISGALAYCTFGTSRNLQVLLNYIKLCFLRSVCIHFLKVIAHA